MVKLYLNAPLKNEEYSFQPDLYHTARHADTQGCKPVFSFFLYSSRISGILASAFFHTNPAYLAFQSPARAPFGGISCNESCSTEELLFLLSCIECTAAGENLTQLIITTRPSCYNTQLHRLLHACYLKNGYVVSTAHLNLHIPVQAASFIQTISTQEVRRLRKCQRAKFEVTKEESVTIEAVYGFIKDSFDRKNYPLSITESQLATLFDQFPDKFLLFAARHEGRFIAMSIAVRVNSKVMYNFLMADLHSYRSFSPGVLLYEKMYNYCQHENITILDQGISVDHHGVVKPDLIRFKKNLGGKESLKIIYRKLITR